jgi:hypothetical protein
MLYIGVSRLIENSQVTENLWCGKWKTWIRFHGPVHGKYREVTTWGIHRWDTEGLGLQEYEGSSFRKTFVGLLEWSSKHPLWQSPCLWLFPLWVLPASERWRESSEGQGLESFKDGVPVYVSLVLCAFVSECSVCRGSIQFNPKLKYVVLL